MLEIKMIFANNEEKMKVMEAIHNCLVGDKAYVKSSVLLNCDEDNTGYLQVCTYNDSTNSRLVLDMKDANVVEGQLCKEN